MKLPSLRAVSTEAKLLLIGIPVLLWTFAPVYHMVLFAVSPKQSAFEGNLWPEHPTLNNFAIVLGEKHYYLNHFWLQLWNSLVIAVATGVLTLLVATCAAFAISRLKVKGGRTVMNLALFTYFIPAAFLAVPMYRTMGLYGLLNNQWSLILAMLALASPYAIWVLKQASDKLPEELDEAAYIDGASPLQLFRLVYLPLMAPSLVAVGTYALLLAWNEYLYAFLLLSNRRHTRGRPRQFSRCRRFALGVVDGDGPDLRPAPRRDLLHLPPLHGGRADRRRGEELIPSGDFELRNPAGPRSAARRPFPRGICAGFRRTPSPATRPAVADR
jgi:multiple sugar transport system permease protein